MTLLDLMRQRVSSGQPIYFLGELSGQAFTAHAAAVSALRRELGRPVRVIYDWDDTEPSTAERHSLLKRDAIVASRTSHGR